MPLQSATPRQAVHTRTIRCQGFRREDGLWDIEGCLTDTRNEPMHTYDRGRIEAGEHLHEMWIRLTVDAQLKVIDIQASTVHAPYAACPSFPERFGKLIGQTIEPGWTAKVRLLLGGRLGCTHLVELLGPIATTAVQTLYAWRQENGSHVAPPPDFINTCHALAADGEVALRLWPESRKDLSA